MRKRNATLHSYIYTGNFQSLNKTSKKRSKNKRKSKRKFKIY